MCDKCKLYGDSSCILTILGMWDKSVHMQTTSGCLKAAHVTNGSNLSSSSLNFILYFLLYLHHSASLQMDMAGMTRVDIFIFTPVYDIRSEVFL